MTNGSKLNYGGLIVTVNTKTLKIFTALLVINVYAGAVP